MIISKDKFGRLELFASLERERQEIKKLLETSSSEMAAEDIFISEYLNFDDYKFENLADQIALWSGPAISDGKNIYYYGNYALDSWLEKLYKGEVVTFDVVKE